MNDAIAQAIVEQLKPIFVYIGSFVILGFVSLGGTLISLWWNNKGKEKEKDDDIIKRLITVEVKLNTVIKDINALGTKIRGR